MSVDLIVSVPVFHILESNICQHSNFTNRWFRAYCSEPLVNLNLDDLSFDGFCLFFDVYTDDPSERQRRCLRLGHWWRESPAGGYYGEGNVRIQRLPMSHIQGKVKT